MKVQIISSSREEIDDYYKSIARTICHYLAANNCDLVYGGGCTSMMGICYDEFSRMGRNIYAYTNEKYESDLKQLPLAIPKLCDTTFDLKKEMFNESDFIVCLPGGSGTLSELLSYIEEKRSNDKDTPIIIYDENGFYDKTLSVIDDFIKDGFSSDTIRDTYDIARNRSEFEELFINIQMEKGRLK